MSQQAWNLLAREFEDSVCDITSTSGECLAELVARTRPNRRRTLVDAGCGIGTFVERFGERFGNVIAFDFAQTMVKRARRRCRVLKHVTWKSMPLENAGERIGRIAHLAVCLNVITSPDADLRIRQWESLAMLVRPGGHLLVVVPSLESAHYVAETEAGADLPQAAESQAAEPQAAEPQAAEPQAAEPQAAEPQNAMPDLIRRTDTRQKHYSRAVLRRRVTRQGFRVLSLRRIYYPWSEEGLEHSAAKSPWDWVCLAQKAK